MFKSIITFTVLLNFIVLYKSESTLLAKEQTLHQYVRFDLHKDRTDGDGPRIVSKNWHGLGNISIDASFPKTIGGKEKIYFFSNDKYYRYDFDADKLDEGYPKLISREWKNLDIFTIDASVAVGNKIYFFKDSNYYRYDYKNDDLDKGYPKTISKGWPGLDFSKIESAVKRDQYVYFFSQGFYQKYDLKLNKVISEKIKVNEFSWSGLWPSGPEASFYREKNGMYYYFKNNQKQTPTLDQNVILLTLDGLRGDEFFNQVDDKEQAKGVTFLPHFWKNLAKEGVVLGDNRLNSSFVLANSTGISHPGYLSLFSGQKIVECRSNEDYTGNCPRGNVVKTFVDRLRDEMKVPKDKIAVFASWKRIEDAVTKDKRYSQNHLKYEKNYFKYQMEKNGKDKFSNKIPFKFYKQETKRQKHRLITLNAGFLPFEDPKNPAPHKKINKKYKSWMKYSNFESKERPDEFTFAHAMQFLKDNKPKFLYIYLVDSDSFGHKNDYPGYMKQISIYDEYIKKIVETLKKMGSYGKKTNLVITTDHSRGIGDEWHTHGISWMKEKESSENIKNIWAFLWGPSVQALGSLKNSNYSHIHLRPTMEKMLGLSPQLGEENIVKEAFE